MLRNGMIILWTFTICFGIMNPTIALMCEGAKPPTATVSKSIVTDSMLFHVYRVLAGMCAISALVFTILHKACKKQQPSDSEKKLFFNSVNNSLLIEFIIIVVIIELLAKAFIITVANTF